MPQSNAHGEHMVSMLLHPGLYEDIQPSTNLLAGMDHNHTGVHLEPLGSAKQPELCCQEGLDQVLHPNAEMGPPESNGYNSPRTKGLNLI